MDRHPDQEWSERRRRRSQPVPGTLERCQAGQQRAELLAGRPLARGEHQQPQTGAEAGLLGPPFERGAQAVPDGRRRGARREERQVAGQPGGGGDRLEQELDQRQLPGPQPVQRAEQGEQRFGLAAGRWPSGRSGAPVQRSSARASGLGSWEVVLGQLDHFRGGVPDPQLVAEQLGQALVRADEPTK